MQPTIWGTSSVHLINTMRFSLLRPLFSVEKWYGEITIWTFKNLFVILIKWCKWNCRDKKREGGDLHKAWLQKSSYSSLMWLESSSCRRGVGISSLRLLRQAVKPEASVQGLSSSFRSPAASSPPALLPAISDML